MANHHLLTVVITHGSCDGEYGYYLIDDVEVRNVTFPSLDALNLYRRVHDIVDTVIVTKPVTIRIATTGPNGDGFITISGTSQ